MWGKAGKQCCGDCRSIVAGPIETPAPPEPAALFEAVWSAPHDVGARQVLADALIEREDPRGRFLALELEGGPAARAEAQALLEAHGNAWYGSWFHHWDALVHEAGFPVEVRVDRAIRRTRSLRDAPIWLTPAAEGGLRGPLCAGLASSRRSPRPGSTCAGFPAMRGARTC
ncbi:MAG: hypothetical protein H6736_05440 [Alphaproteobacteria bacterium]|nr:hypothetical protein [Alphaproteobacteria bacterium]